MIKLNHFLASKNTSFSLHLIFSNNLNFFNPIIKLNIKYFNLNNALRPFYLYDLLNSMMFCNMIYGD